jgi:predicted nuclease of predicted toxin-antitoxin system
VKFLLDENISTDLPLLEQVLRGKGYDVEAIASIAPSIPDLEVLNLAIQQGRTIISFDSDFSDYRFRDDLLIPYGVIFLERSKHKVCPDDPLMTRKIVAGIDSIADEAESKPSIIYNTIFTFTQPTPYGLMKIRPKKHKDKKEIITNLAYFEEQLPISSESEMKSIPVTHEKSVHQASNKDGDEI